MYDHFVFLESSDKETSTFQKIILGTMQGDYTNNNPYPVIKHIRSIRIGFSIYKIKAAISKGIIYSNFPKYIKNRK